MLEIGSVLGILGALLVGAMSPGASFVVVSRIALMQSRSNGLAAALGMGLGGLLFATLALGGLVALLQQVEWLFAILKLMGGVYLLVLALGTWRGAARPLPDLGAAGLHHKSAGRAVLLGFVTQVSNPKTVVVYASIFAAFLSGSAPAWMLFTLPLLIFLVEAGWYSLVALGFSAQRPRSLYLAAKVWIDRVTGLVMGALGARLIYEGEHDLLT